MGLSKYDLDTPALLLNQEALERNIAKMAAWSQEMDCAVRPHFKVHRTVRIARQQLAAGAVGITCAKLAEAEVLAEHGVENVLLANEVAGERKISRLVSLAERINFVVFVDHLEVTRQIARTARRRGVTVEVLVEVDVGMHRCGVPPGPEAVQLARLVAQEEGLRFRGLAAYEGHLVALEPGPEKTRQIKEALQPLGELRAQLEAEGLPVEMVCAAGTGSFMITGTLPYVDEVHPGTYALMDLLYAKAGAPFEFAMTVLATVISKRPGRLITDAGLKALHPVFGWPQVGGQDNLTVRFLSAEHGVLNAQGQTEVQVGDKLEFIPYYADGTINLFERWYVIRGEEVVDVWPMEARGCSK
ncbi:MAG TPA: DSD1 family PLP-dependent enzyme [Armatimonadetes bacterium]|nr:DSD1 family PLP-dependent enzyme [Armatimonadota bacterium]